MEIICSKINRSLHYGDLLFETIRVKGGLPMYLNLHLERLKSGMAYLKFPLDLFDEQQLILAIRQEISSQQLHDGRLRITCLRGGNGYYLPIQPEPVIYLSSEAVTFTNEPCRQLGVYSHLKRPCDELHTYKTGNALIQVMASIFAREQGLDDCLVLNEYGHVACALHANVWVVKKGVLYTTDHLQGAVNGCMQKQIKYLCIAKNIPIVEGAIPLHMLEDADEIFLSSSIRKIVPVISFNDRSYATDTASVLFGYID